MAVASSDGDEEKGVEPRPSKLQEDGEQSRPERVQVKKAQPQSQCQCKREKEQKFAQADGEIAQAQTEIEADGVEVADGDQRINAGVKQQDFIEYRQMRGPCPLEPTQVDGQTQDGEDEKFEPVGAAFSGPTGEGHERGHRDRQESVEREPLGGESAAIHRHEHVGHAQQGRQKHLHDPWQPAHPGAKTWGEEGRREVRSERQQSGYGNQG